MFFSFSVLFSLVLAFWNQPPAEVNLSPITIPGGLPHSKKDLNGRLTWTANCLLAWKLITLPLPYYAIVHIITIILSFLSIIPVSHCRSLTAAFSQLHHLCYSEDCFLLQLPLSPIPTCSLPFPPTPPRTHHLNSQG